MLLNCNLFFYFVDPLNCLIIMIQYMIYYVCTMYKGESKTVQLKQEDSRARTMLISFDNVQPIATLVAH